MNVLLAGGSGPLTEQIIHRLNKEGHRIFLLSDSHCAQTREPHIFEVYRFDYDSESIMQVFESVRPDLTLCLGAWDPVYSWQQPQADAVRFVSGTMNLLTAFSVMTTGRFVFLSSGEIYEQSAEGFHAETDAPTCHSPKAMAIAQAEQLCASFVNDRKLDVVTLRLDNLYFIPKTREECTDVCSQLSLASVESGSINYHEQQEFSMLYLSDAVEYIYRVMAAKELKHPVYNISSSEVVTEQVLSEMIAAAETQKPELFGLTARANRRVLSNARFQEEFSMKFFWDAKKMATETVRYMREHPNAFKPVGQRKESFFHRFRRKFGAFLAAVVPYVENMILFIPFFMLNNRAVGSRFFDRLDFYLLYVLLFAIVFGQQQATFSAILATCGYFFRQMYGKTGFQVLSNYNTYVWLAQLFIVGLAVGYLRDRLSEQAKESAEEKSYLQDRIHDITDINYSNVRVKDSLQTEIVNQSNSVGKIYEITSTLNQRLPEEVLFYAAQIMSKLMNSQHVAVYMVTGSEYARLFSCTSKRAASLGKSIRKDDIAPMYEVLKANRVFINRSLDPGLPSMANAIFDGEEIRTIIMVWDIPWEAMTLGQANMMSVISLLIRDSVLRADRFMGALESQRYGKNGVLNPEAFRTLRRAFLDARSQGLTDCTALVFDLGDQPEHIQTIRAALRQSDYMGLNEEGKLCLLLTNTNQEDAQFVIRRLEGKGYQPIFLEDLS